MARAKLLTLKREIDAELKELEAVRQLCLQLAEVRREVARGEAAQAALTTQRPSLELSRSHRQAELESAREEHARRTAEAQRHRQTRPGFFAQLFRAERWKVWSRANVPLVEAEIEAARFVQSAERGLSEATTALDALIAIIRKAEESLTIPRLRAAQLSQRIDAQRSILGHRLVDEDFFDRGHEASNLTAPWLSDSLHTARVESEKRNTVRH